MGFIDEIKAGSAVAGARWRCRSTALGSGIPVRYQRHMTTLVDPGAAARHAAVTELFEALHGLMTVYESVPEDQQPARWAADAERITGQVGRHLAAARGRLSTTFSITADPLADPPAAMTADNAANPDRKL